MMKERAKQISNNVVSKTMEDYNDNKKDSRITEIYTLEEQRKQTIVRMNDNQRRENEFVHDLYRTLNQVYKHKKTKNPVVRPKTEADKWKEDKSQVKLADISQKINEYSK